MKKNFDSKAETETAEIQNSKTERKPKGRRGNKPKHSPKGKSDGGKRGNVNDAAYYYTDPNVLASVTNFSFTEFLGVPATIGETLVQPTDTGFTTLTENVANVTVFKMNPSVQPTATEGNTGMEAINTVALRNYTGLTAGNGKTAQYSQADPMIATLGIGSAVSMYSHLKRAFQCYQLVNQRNREYPRLLYKAMGINWDDFKANIANYRDQFNLLVCQFDKIPIFDSITYLDKCKHMYEFIYVDEDSPLAQTYLFVPNSVWTLNEAYDPSGSGLVTTDLYDTPIKTMAELLDIFATQINALTTSSTLNYVYSDILRLISNGKGKSFVLETIPLMPDPKYGPIINQEIHHWINNMMMTGLPIAKDAAPAAITRGGTNYNDVSCDGSTGGILYHPTFIFRTEPSAGNVKVLAKVRSDVYKMWWNNNFINFDSMTPSIEDKVAATRLAVRANLLTYTDSDTSETMYTYAQDIDLGDFYCVSMATYSDVDTVVGSNTNLYIPEANASNLNWYNYVGKFDVLNKLKYAPRLAIADGAGHLASGENKLKALSGDLSYYTLLPHAVTKRMKDAEMFGLFDFRMQF